MVGTLNFELRDAPPELWDKSRWPVLTMLILHANVRNRCWPTVDYLADKLSLSTATVVHALQWLRNHDAIVVVQPKDRLDDESHLPPRQHVYQLTGELVIDEKRIPYLYVGKEHGQDEVSKIKTSASEVSKSKTSNPKTSKTGNQTIYSKDSQLNQTLELGESGAALVKALAEATGCDPLLNQKEITELALHLDATGYSAQNVLNWYQRCWLTSWRGPRGLPTLKEVRQMIGQVRLLPALQVDGEDRYTDNSYFQGRDLDEQPTVADQLRRERYDGKWKDQWLATLGDLQGKLNKATYDTWLSHLYLIDVVEREDGIVEFRVEAPDHYVKDWIERNLMASFEENLCGICHFPARPLRSGQIGTGVEIILEDGSL